ncbi:MAG TPA: cation diffusion facilitator family transporter [Patescibacteria group bacterium]|nr:cation diffusion facilitator family transporter [Patescibacteria group bacterium]
MEKKRAALVAIVGGLTIFAIKLVSYFMSGSVALLSDALESIVNIAASLLMFFAVYISGMPPDEEHHYGHQKIENITSLIEGLSILTAALFIVHTALEKIGNPQPLPRVELALGVNLFASLLNGALSLFLSRSASETGSLALEGDAKHLLSDVVTSVGIAAGLLAAKRFELYILDPVMALIVSVLIVRMGVGLVLKAARGLMDEDCPEAEAKIMEILERYESRYVDYHDVKSRRSGGQVFAELHLSVDGSLTVEETHEFTDHLEEDLRNELPEVTITIHVEPYTDE